MNLYKKVSIKIFVRASCQKPGSKRKNRRHFAPIGITGPCLVSKESQNDSTQETGNRFRIWVPIWVIVTNNCPYTAHFDQNCENRMWQIVRVTLEC